MLIPRPAHRAGGITVDQTARRRRTASIEAALWIVMGVLAFLSKDNPNLVYPQVLYLMLGLLGSTFGTSLAVRRWPDRRTLHAATLLGGFASIAGLQVWSGGPESILWALYLLPVFTAAILLQGRELAWTALGACASNAVLYAASDLAWTREIMFELALKTGILALAAAATWALSRSERDAEERGARQRELIGRLEESARLVAETREREKGLAAIAAVGAGAAHDLSTPLMVIRSYARLHLEEGVGEPMLERDLQRIDAAASFCQDLVGGMMARGNGESAPRRLSAVVESALALAEPILRTRKVEIERAYPEETLTVAAPQNSLERVVLNLVGNSAKAMKDGGSLRVRIERQESSHGTWAVAVFEDDGPGIPPDILSHLFQPFASSRKGKGGNGLGLYVSRQAVMKAGGRLEAENRPEGGARFTLRLPLLGAPQPAAA